MEEGEGSEKIDIGIAMELAKEAARLAIQEEGGTNQNNNRDGSVINKKTLDELKGITSVFGALKELSSNPINKAIEDKVGGMAAQVVENAFGGQQRAPEDLMSQLMNSNLAFGIGQGIGNNTPNIIDALTKNFGSKSAEKMIDNVIGGQQQANQNGGSEQSNVEMLLSLDANNPEHVSMYAESQGNISVDLARKMLMMHQDDIIKKMEQGGAQHNTAGNQAQQVQHEQVYEQPHQQAPMQQQMQPQDMTGKSEDQSVAELLKLYMKETSQTMEQLTHEIIDLKEELNTVRNTQSMTYESTDESVAAEIVEVVDDEHNDVLILESISDAEIIDDEHKDIKSESEAIVSPIKRGSIQKPDMRKDIESNS